MSTVFHQEKDVLSENWNQAAVHYLNGFATHNQVNWDDYLPLPENAYNSSVQHSTKQTRFEFDLGYELTMPLD